MADEKNEAAPTPVPEPAPEEPKKVELPETFQLEELDQLKLAASNDRLGRLMAEFQLMQTQAQQLQTQIKQHNEDLTTTNLAQRALILAVGEKYHVGPAIFRYSIELKTGICTLKKAPPKG